MDPATGGMGGSVATGGAGGSTAGGTGGVQSGGAAGSMPGGAGGGTASALMVESTVFVDGMMISADYRCQNPSPPLSWSGGPAETLSYAITLIDQTPGIAQGALHWVIYDIPAGTTSLSEGVPIGYMPATPAGAKQAPIWNGTLGYNGPCAPFGTNTYELTLHAIDVATLPGLSMSSSGAEVVAQIEAHSLASDVITVTSSP
jgi:Raf kinase inhibitor-like YbhB/YbcL family protein